MTFRIGQPIICIWAAGQHPESDTENVVKGETYTVRWCGPSITLPTGKMLLREIVNPIGDRGEEVGFHPWRFRPLVERKADIAAFTSVLSPKPLVDA